MRPPPAGNNEDLSRRVSVATLRRLFGLAVPYRRLLYLSAGLTLIASGMQLAVPILLRDSVNRIVESRDLGALDRDVALVFVVILSGAGLGYLRFVAAARAGNAIVRDLRVRLFAHLQRLPVAYFDKARSGDLASYLSNDVTQLQATLTDDLTSFASNLLLAVGGVAVAVWMNARLTVVVLSVLLAMTAFFVIAGRTLRKLNRESLDALADALGNITEALANIRLVKAFARESHEDARAGEGLEMVRALANRGSRLEAAMGSVAVSSIFLLMLGLMWVGSRQLLAGATTPGELLGFAAVAFVILPPISLLASLYTRLQRAVGASERVFAILDTAPEPPDAPDALPFPSGPGEVRFVGLSFRYVPDVPVLTDLSLVLDAGNVTAVVGPSGAGKTTLSALLYRFYDPQDGRIEIDGVDIAHIARRALRENVGIVPQDPILFNGTIRENIRYGRLDATDAEVEQAARDANVEEFVRALPAGYETVLGERGVTLSGGQRQRVAIARALLKDPRILVLDEATSALDNRSEALVREALDRLMRGRTTLVIAHRLTTVQNADRIAVLAEGRVVEQGTHAELMQGGGPYRELYEMAGA